MRANLPNRVLMISTHGYVAAKPELGLPDTGGQVVYVLEIARCLGRMGYQVDILTRRFEDQPAEETVQEGVRVLRFPCGGTGFIPKETLCHSLPEWVEAASKHYTRRAGEIAFINSHYWDAGLAGLELGRRLGAPHVHTPHSLGVWKRDSMPGNDADKERRYNFRERIRNERAVYEAANLVVATTPQQKSLLHESPEYGLDESRVLVIPPGYDDTRFFPVSDATRRTIKHELDLEGKIIFAVGRLARNKGYDLLIRAMSPVFRRIPEARLLLAIGASHFNKDEEAQSQELINLARELGFENRVLLRDYIPDELLPNYYRAADVFALSSRYEPFGMTAVEAMACGTPTVITTEGGLWEQVTWGLEGVYADPNDTESFGHIVCKVLYYSRLAAQLSTHGAQLARSNFTWTAITQRLLGEALALKPTVATREPYRKERFGALAGPSIA